MLGRLHEQHQPLCALKAAQAIDCATDCITRHAAIPARPAASQCHGMSLRVGKTKHSPALRLPMTDGLLLSVDVEVGRDCRRKHQLPGAQSAAFEGLDRFAGGTPSPLATPDMVSSHSSKRVLLRLLRHTGRRAPAEALAARTTHQASFGRPSESSYGLPASHRGQRFTPDQSGTGQAGGGGYLLLSKCHPWMALDPGSVR